MLSTSGIFWPRRVRIIIMSAPVTKSMKCDAGDDAGRAYIRTCGTQLPDR